MSHTNNKVFNSALPATLDVIAGPSEDLAIICHELRNSLAVVRGAARLLKSTAASDAALARSLIERHVDQMSRHIEDLLEPVPRAMRVNGLQLTQIDLRGVARYATEAIGPEMRRHSHRLAVNLPDQPLWVLADAVRLEQAVSNLLINAVKYTPEGGQITFTMEREENLVFTRIRDSGVGIEAAMLTRVFEMFVQVDATLPLANGGHGIGLAVVKNLVELHGGRVSATSPGLGLGSEFTIVLPVLSRARNGAAYVRSRTDAMK